MYITYINMYVEYMCVEYKSRHTCMYYNYRNGAMLSLKSKTDSLSYMVRHL